MYPKVGRGAKFRTVEYQHKNVAFPMQMVGTQIATMGVSIQCNESSKTLIIIISGQCPTSQVLFLSMSRQGISPFNFTLRTTIGGQESFSASAPIWVHTGALRFARIPQSTKQLTIRDGGVIINLI